MEFSLRDNIHISEDVPFSRVLFRAAELQYVDEEPRAEGGEERRQDDTNALLYLHRNVQVGFAIPTHAQV